MRTVGLSPKAVLAFLYPLIATAVGVLGSWIVTGEFNDTELRTALAGTGASAVALLGAYLGRPGIVRSDVEPDA